MKILNKILNKIKLKKSNNSMVYKANFNEDCTENDKLKFIWGIKSHDDLSGNKCNLMTVNDFDIIYLKERNKYIINVETIYYFNDGYDGEKYYLNHILDQFTNWMTEHNYNTEYQIRLWNFGTISFDSEFSSIEEAYAAFKCMIKGF